LNSNTKTYGEYEVTLDSKGRIMLPAGLKKQVPDSECEEVFMICKGPEKFITLYTQSQWKRVEAFIDRINDFNEEGEELKSYLVSATPIELDSAGRIVIPKRMLTKANITKDIMLHGMKDKIAIWDATEYDDFRDGIDQDRVKQLKSKILGTDHLNPLLG